MKTLGRIYDIPTKLTIPLKSRVAREYVRFNYYSQAKALRELRDYAKSIKKDFLMAANINPPGNPLGGTSIKVHGEVLDFLLLEAGYTRIGWPRERVYRANAFSYLYTRAATSCPSALDAYPDETTDKEIFWSPKDVKLFLAEARAFGGTLMYSLFAVTKDVPAVWTGPFFQQRCGEWLVNCLLRAYHEEASRLLTSGQRWEDVAKILSKKLDPSNEAIALYNGFFRENKDCYEGVEPYVQVMLLCSVPTIEWHYGSSLQKYRELEGCLQLLLDANILFNIITDEQVPEMGEGLLILPDPACLSEQTIEKIMKFRSNRGNLLAVGQPGKYTEEYEEREKPPLITSPAGEKDLGEIICLDEFGKRYLENRSEEALSAMRDTLLYLHNPFVARGLPRNVVLTAFYRNEKVIIHLMNYENSIKRDVNLELSKELNDIQVKTPDEVKNSHWITYSNIL